MGLKGGHFYFFKIEDEHLTQLQAFHAQELGFRKMVDILQRTELPGEFPQTLVHQGDTRCHQGSHYDPLPEMNEQDQGCHHCQDQRNFCHCLDKGAA
jgi:hypothetical protein